MHDFPQLPVREQASKQLVLYATRFSENLNDLQLLASQLQNASNAVFDRANMEGHITTTALILDESLTRVLVIHHNIFNQEMPPGGHYENDRTLLDSALREAIEETGVTNLEPVPWAGDLVIPFDIDTHFVPANPAKGEGDHFHHDFCFLLRATGDVSISPQLEEVRSVRWIPLADFGLLPDRYATRVHARLSAYLATRDKRNFYTAQ